MADENKTLRAALELIAAHTGSTIDNPQMPIDSDEAHQTGAARAFVLMAAIAQSALYSPHTFPEIAQRILGAQHTFPETVTDRVHETIRRIIGEDAKAEGKS